MKQFKILLSATAALAMSMPLSAQLKVTNDGQVRIGYSATSSDDSNASGSSLLILPPSSSSLLAGKVSLGYGNISFGSMKLTPGLLELNTTKGLVFKTNNEVIFSYYDGPVPGEPILGGVVFNKDITVPSTWTNSDARLKKDITPLDGTGIALLELSPVSYRLTGENISDLTSNENILTTDVEATESSVDAVTTKFDDRVHFGFIAQEVQHLYPELVKADENGLLAIDYTGFVPLLVDAVKNLTEKVNQQEELIRTLMPATKMRSKSAGVDELIDKTQSIVLYQNRPNPFNVTTEIGCVVPKEIKEAFITIYDMQGKQLRRIPVTERGEVSVSVDGSTLNPGMYIYTLIADGNEAASKRMIITD